MLARVCFYYESKENDKKTLLLEVLPISEIQSMSVAISNTSLLFGRLMDIVLTYSIVFFVIPGAYPLLNKQLLETI